MNKLEKRIRGFHPEFDPLASPPPISPAPPETDRPLWSVMIPTFNCAPYLKQTLESVLAQDPGPERMQIEVIDDCSTKDDPEAVVREIGKGRVGFYRKLKNEGAVANFNTCIDHSRGELVHILHGDDYILPGFYSKIQATYDKNPDITLVAARVFYVDEEGILLTVSPRLKNLEQHQNVVNDLYYGNPFQFAGTVVRRKFYEENGGFSLQLKHTADWQMWMRAFSDGGGIILSDVLAAYRTFSSNDTSRLMRTAENLKDRERLALYFASRFCDFSLPRANQDNVLIAERQKTQFRLLNDHEAAVSNEEFWQSRATWMNKLMRKARSLKSFIN